MLHDEVETSEGSYERTGDGEHDDHREYQHHSRIMFSEPEEEQFTFFLYMTFLINHREIRERDFSYNLRPEE